MRGSVPILLLGVILPVIAQTPAPKYRAEVVLYEHFFQRVGPLRSDGIITERNGRLSRIVAPKLQAVIGLTDSEVQTLYSVTDDCFAKLRGLPQADGAVFEERIQILSHGYSSDEVRDAVARLHRQHEEVVLSHIEQLKAAYGETRFRVLDEYVHSGKAKNELELWLEHVKAN